MALSSVSSETPLFWLYDIQKCPYWQSSRKDLTACHSKIDDRMPFKMGLCLHHSKWNYIFIIQNGTIFSSFKRGLYFHHSKWEYIFIIQNGTTFASFKWDYICIILNDKNIYDHYIVESTFRHCTTFHKNLKLLKVSNVFKMRIVQTVYKSLNHIPPDIFNNYFQKRSDILQHNTINCYKSHVPRARTNLGKQTLKIRGTKYYTELFVIIITKKYI